MTDSSSDLRYPIGTWNYPGTTTAAEWKDWIREIAAAPMQMRAVVAGLSPAQLDTRYRPDGWTVRQVVHHVPESHMNAYVRFKLALTEDAPMIKPYDEARWAQTPDTRLPIEPSLELLDGLHVRWLQVLQSMSASDFARTFRHPEVGTLNLGQYLGSYAWHSRHHVAHIAGLRGRMGW